MKKKLWILLILAITILSFVFLRGKITHERFDSTLWKTANLNSEENVSLRWDMMNDLRKKYDLVGMTKAEITDLLGVPEDSTNTEYDYYLGYSKTGINTGSLTITFNNKNIVMNIRVWQG